jgi:DUF971 family protein
VTFVVLFEGAEIAAELRDLHHEVISFLRYHVSANSLRETPMAGLDETTKIPTEIKLHQKSRILELSFEGGERFELSYEFLRVFTPSAEARGSWARAGGSAGRQARRRHRSRVEAVGNYAIRPVFSDGHDSGLYSWDLLYNLGVNRDQLWQAYLNRLEQEHASRDPPSPGRQLAAASTVLAASMIQRDSSPSLPTDDERQKHDPLWLSGSRRGREGAACRRCFRLRCPALRPDE